MAKWGCVVSCLVVALTVIGPRTANAQPATDKEPPIVFFVARGAPNACGRGCSKWIAAEGTLTQGSFQRLLAVVRKPGNGGLPIYFNSDGGLLGAARAVGGVLRYYNMTARIGKTSPDACPNGNNEDPACRKVMQEGAIVNAQLVTSSAVCYSACFYAFVGAAVRSVPEGAKLGIHASRSTPEAIAREKAGGKTNEQLKLDRKRYLADMGIDPVVADLSEQFPPETMHILSKEEIVRFRIEKRDSR